MSPDAELYAQAREASIEEVAGVRLFRAGRRLRGECPLCGASKGKKAGGAFSVDSERGIYKCFGCDGSGDVIRLEQQLRGGTPREAALRLVGALPAGETRTGVRQVKAAPAPTGSALRIAADLWRQGRPAMLSPAEAYLRGRGISGPLLGQALEHLKFHPNAFWGVNDETGLAIRAPAMLGLVVAPSGATGGIHVTYLRPAGAGFAKARLEPAKRMWGPQKDAHGRPGGVWLIGPEGDGPLVVGEGIESALSAAMLRGHDGPIVAALSLGALQGGWLTDRWGRRNPDCVVADPESPAFTWAGDWPEVIVAVDRDMAPVKVKVRGFQGGTAEHLLSPDERARICGALAAAHWRRERGTNAVRAIAPAVGRDFNDELMARLRDDLLADGDE